MKAGKNQVEIGKVLVKVGGRSFGDNVVDVGEHEVRGKASEDFVNKALEGGGGAGEPLSHALVLEETETGPKGSLFLGSVVEFNLVKASWSKPFESNRMESKKMGKITKGIEAN